MQETTDLAHLKPASNDEIDLGLLIKKLIEQWLLIASITTVGAAIGVLAALAIPKQYRVEAIFDKPTTTDVAPLLAQPFIKLDAQTVLGDFLKNLKSQALVEEALMSNNLLTDEEGQNLNKQERYTVISEFTQDIRIAPAKFDFLPELDGQVEDLDQISLSLLSSKPADAQKVLNSLLLLAADKTNNDFAADITGAKIVEISRLNNQIAQLSSEAASIRSGIVSDYESAINIADKLGISQPTLRDFASEDLYLKGTEVLQIELNALKEAPLKLGSIVTGYDSDGKPLAETAESIQGRIGALSSFELDLTKVLYVSPDVETQIPAIAEKPNRKLIAVAATVLGGFLALFVALIRIAIGPKD